MPKRDRVSLEIEIKKIGRGLEQVERELKGLTGAVDREGRKIRLDTAKIGRGFKNLGSSVLNLKNLIIGLAGAAGLGLLARSFIKTAATMEQFQIALDTITKGRGEETFRALNEWALKMPVNTEKAIQTYIQLRAMGLEPTLDMMTTLIDTMAATGRGEEALEGVARALGQIYSRGKLSMEELNQLAEWGVPAKRILAEGLGVAVGQLEEMAKKGLEANRVVKILFDGLKREYGGLSVASQKTWQGMTESLRSYWKEFQRLVAESGPFQVLKARLHDLVTYFDRAMKTGDFQRWAETTAKAVLESFRVMSYGAQALIEAIDQVKLAFASVGMVFAKSMQIWQEAPGITRWLPPTALAKRLAESIPEHEVETLIETFDMMGTSAAQNISNIEQMFQTARAALDEMIAAAGRSAAGVKKMGESTGLAAGEIARLTAETKKLDETAKSTKILQSQYWQDLADAIVNDIRPAWDDYKKSIQGAANAIVSDVRPKLEESKTLMGEFASAASDSLQHGFFDPFYDGINGIDDAFKQLGISLLNSWTRVLGQMSEKWLMNVFNLQGAAGGGGGGGGGGLLGFFGSILGFKSGGVVPGGWRPVLQVPGFQHGGIVRRPTLGLLGEGGEDELVVPLKGGKVPVEKKGAEGPTNININIVAADAASFQDMVRRNPGAILEPVLESLGRAGVMRAAIRESI